MKKYILFFAVFLFSMVVVRCQNNDLATIYPYQEMVSKAQGALNSRDYETSYKTYCLMDSVYGIAAVDYTSFMYFLNLTHWYNSGSDAEKNLLFRIAKIKWFDMAHLEREAAGYKIDTLDYWNDLLAIVKPRGYQDTVYQNRLLAMKKADQSLRHLIGDSRHNEDSVWAALHEVEARNETELKQLIAERGFPTWTRVGYLCNDQATYIVQNMSQEFLHWYLKEAMAAADSGDYNPGGILEYLIDREDINRPNLNEAYMSELKTMCDEDQRLRKQLLKDDGGSDKLWQEINATDSLHIVRLQELIAQYGFPTYNNVGHQGVNDAALIAQHADPDFLHCFLEQATPAAAEGDFDLTWIAMMTDRDLVCQGKPQLYGTQLLTRDGITAFEPIEDIERLDERRASMGLGPIADYMKLYGMTELIIHPIKKNSIITGQ